MGLTYGELRRMRDEGEMGWATEPETPDERSLPQPALGGEEEGLVETEQGEAFAFEVLGLSPNPHLALRRIERG